MQQSPVPNRLRQRLLGALVVVALAVLILPPWMDGGGLKTPAVLPVPATPTVDQPAKITVPAPTPEQQAALSHPPAPFLPADEPKSAPSSPVTVDTAPPPTPETAKSSSAVSSMPTQSPAAVDTPSTRTPETVPDKQTSSSTAPAASTTNTGKTHSDARSAPSDSAAPTKSASTSSQEWVVQLGSFSDELNARGLAKSVTDAGFKVDIYPLFAKKGTVWRVRVGPFATREQAVKSTIQLRERLGRDGLVMPK